VKQDIELYEVHPEEYLKIQSKRPDYRDSIQKTVELAVTYGKEKKKIAIVDFCGGIGQVTGKIAQKVPVARAHIIDINEDFLKIARSLQIKVDQLETTCSDIREVNLKKEYDLVLSVFAYHHVPDVDKTLYLSKVRDALKNDGQLVLTEIYLPDEKTTLSYYEKLLREIPEKNELLEKFLKQTAMSKDFEFKVSKEFAAKQLADLGFKEVESVKIWPLDNSFPADIGTFVQVFALSQQIDV
jgi:ubiquinone/menaquinone biosynthesis C-methylase UbiE